MKRNAQGVNIDEGIPLHEEQEFDLLYLTLYPAQEKKLEGWLSSSHKESSLTLGGQIGSGKTTLLHKAIFASDIKPDIWLRFDENASDTSLGDFIAITLLGLIKALLDKDLTFIKSASLMTDLMPESKIDTSEMLKLSWQALNERLNPSVKSLANFKAKRETVGVINDPKITDYFLDAIIYLIDDFKLGAGRAPLIVATGIDKFSVESTAFHSIQDVLHRLKSAKTLFEVNATHIYASNRHELFEPSDSILLPRAEKINIVNLLKVRLGAYANKHEQNINVLADFSGGNPRQAVRLLMHYFRAKKDRTLTDEGAIAMAVKKTSVDYFSFSERPDYNLIRTVDKDNFILSSTISSQGDISTGLKAVYGNWIFLGKTIEIDKREAIINPIVLGSFSEKDSPVEYMSTVLKKFAEAAGISSIGLSFNDSSEHSRNLSFDSLFSEINEFIDSSLAGVFEDVSASLLNKNRADRIFIVYKDFEMTDAARSYLFAKSNTLEHQSCKHFKINYEKGKLASDSIDMILNDLDQNEHHIDILSFEFDSDWPIDELAKIESKRDCFLEHQILWWLSEVQLRAILPQLPQLRQLFEVYSLEDALLSSLSLEEIEADIHYLELIDDELCGTQIEELKKVAKYLHIKKGVNG
jgi:hypothetical protein